MYIKNKVVDDDFKECIGEMTLPKIEETTVPYIDRSNKMLLKVLEEYALTNLLLAIKEGQTFVYNIGISRLHKDEKMHTVGAHEIMALAELIAGEFMQGYSFDFDYEKFIITRI